MASVPFNNLITFSRGSNATVTGPTGLVQWAPNNLLTFSEQFDNAVWGKDRITVTANSAAAPDGTLTAEAVVPTAVAGTHGFGTAPSVTITSGVTYTASVYAKASGYNYFRLRVYNGSSNLDTYFDISTGAVATIAAGVTASIQDGGNGWYRCVCTFTAAATVAGSVFVVQPHVAPSDGTASFTGDGTSGILIWGAQLELGSAATTYNSTTVKNLLGFSEAFDNAAWGKGGASLVTGAQANPVNGAFNAQKLMEDTSTGVHRIFQTVTIAAASHTLSFYAKPAGRDWMYMYANGGSQTAYVNIATGAIGPTVGSPTVTATSAGGGWYRVAMTFPNAITTGQTAQIWLASNSTTNTYTGDGNSGVYIYGAQLSDSASLDPYVPTPAAAPSSTAYYGPRFDYDPVTLQPKGLLVEEARTNSLTYSDQFDNAAWAKNNITVTANSASSPDGTVNADTITASGVTTDGINRALATTAAAYTFSAYLKQGNTAFSEIAIVDQGTVINRVRLTYITGALTVVAGSPTGTATNVGNGWWRVTITYTFPAIGAADTFHIFPGAASGGAGEFAYVYGAQLEAGAFATSYIPTVASTVTRSADVATINGSLFSQWYGQTAGSWVSSFTPYVVPGGVVAQISAATNIDRFQLLSDSTGQIAVSTNNVGQGTIDAGTVAAGATNNLAYAYRTNDTAASLSGGAAVADTTVALPVVDRLCLGATVAPAGFLNGHIRSIEYIPARAADFQLQALTTT